MASIATKEKAPEVPWTDDLQSDFDSLLSIGEECISDADLKKLLLRKGSHQSDTKFIVYDGFEPSGRMHIAQGVFKAVNVNKCVNAGGTFVFWVADWFALMNDKLGGDLDKIKTTGEYLQHVWKAAGMKLENVRFIWASEAITASASEYWPMMLRIASQFNVTRIKKCCQIMGRKEGTLTAAQILYPLMQCTDVFFLKADICQLGLDQRKVNALARDYCAATRIKNKPVILSHHMLYGLKQGQAKMSKSDPDSAIFMEDEADAVRRKIMAAYCPREPETTATTTSAEESMQVIQDDLKNPVLDYIQNICMSDPQAKFTVEGTEYTSFDAVKADFCSGAISETALKEALIDQLNALLEPVRRHFVTDPRAQELLEAVRAFKKSAATPLTSTPRRNDLVQASVCPAGAHLVFAPLPIARPTLQSVVDTWFALQKNTNGGPVVLMLQDWCATTAMGVDTKTSDAYFTVFLAALRALAGNAMEGVTILQQSECILKDPSNYWMCVINAGRKFRLIDVMGDCLEDGDGVGHVVARLMTVADVASVSPSSIMNSKISSLATEFLGAQSWSVPQVEDSSAPSLRLQPPRTDGPPQDVDEYFVMDNPKSDAKSKLNKSFAEPGNVDFLPALALAEVFSPTETTVTRSEANGGSTTYNNIEAMRSDYISGALHPGDLKKNCMAPVMVTVLEKVDAELKKSCAKETKILKAWAKKQAKK